MIANDVQVPQYIGCNTKITRGLGQRLHSATHITYYPLIKVNLAEPDTVLFTMDVLKSSIKKTFHRHTVFNNDQQLFKVTTQMNTDDMVAA